MTALWRGATALCERAWEWLLWRGSDRLAARSQDWADTLLARKQFVLRPNSTYGENLFKITGETASSPFAQA
jgi:hypothetical protein